MSGECGKCGNHALECDCFCDRHITDHKWIDMNDGIIALGTEGLVCSQYHAYSLATYYEEGWVPFYGPLFDITGFKVTHWMPLPPPPQHN